MLIDGAFPTIPPRPTFIIGMCSRAKTRIASPACTDSGSRKRDPIPMRETRAIMGMPITLTVLGETVRQQDLDAVFAEFTTVDRQFSPFKADSEISRFNRGEITERAFTPRMREIITLCEKTRQETDGY